MMDTFPNVKEFSDKQLLVHWAAIASKWANIQNEKVSRQEVLDFTKLIIKEIWSRDIASFDGESAASIDLFLEAVKDIISSAVALRSPHAERLASGKKTLIIKSKTFPRMVGQPLGVIAGGPKGSPLVAIVTLSAPEEMSEGEFEKRRSEHTITDAERKEWWGNTFPLWAYGFKLNAVISPPLRIDQKLGAQIVSCPPDQVQRLFEGLLPVYPSNEQALRDAKLQREAKASEAEDVVRPDRMVFLIKPQRGAVEGQPQTIPNFLKLFGEKDFPLLASKKYDGVRHVVLKSDGVRIISDDGEDNTKRLPKLAKLFESIPGKFVIDTNIELWEGDKHLPQEAAASAVKRGDDENLFANILDALYWNGDIHKDSALARKELLARDLAGRDFVESTLVAPTKPINLAPQLEAENKAELQELTERLLKEPGSEGVVVKSGPYDLGGGSKTWWEYHLAAVAPYAKLTNERAQLRAAREGNPGERCSLCQYFVAPDGCKIVRGPVSADLVCDWIQSRETEGVPLYEVSDEDWEAFGRGMIEKQPYQHIVRDAALTPEGPVVMIKDTAKPPHRFSLTKDFHIEHTSLEHHWTQKEVDALIQAGRVQT